MSTLTTTSFHRLYHDIIEEIISRVIETYPGCYEVRDMVDDRIMQYALKEKFEEYRNCATINVTSNRLDRHKIASCVCGAIIEIKPLLQKNGKRTASKINEHIALHSAISVLKYFMAYDYFSQFDLSESLFKKLCSRVLQDYTMELPSTLICDTQGYRLNLLNAMFWSHHKCKKYEYECYRYDIWAYATIFYHIELHNKEKFNQICEKIHTEYI